MKGRWVGLATAAAGWLVFGGPAIQGADRIRLKNREIQVAPGKERVAAVAPAAESPGGLHYLVSVGRAVTAEDHARLGALGFHVVAAVPDTGLVVTASPAAQWNEAGFTWIGELEPADKWSAALPDTGGEGVFLVEGHADTGRETLRWLATQFGLTPEDHPDLLPHQLLLSGPAVEARALATRDEVAYVFPASAELAAGDRVVACAGAVSAGGMIGQYAKVASGWPPDPDGGVTLGLFAGSLTGRIAAAEAQAEIDRALAEWAAHARLGFVASASAAAPRTVAMLFAAGDHGDPYPFDGAGRVLAHAFYPSPPNPEPWAGDMHFDADEAWAVGRDIDLYSVVLHELGHALGLGHSDRPGAVMYPYYRRAHGLSADDIAGIQDLYGSPEPTGGGTPPATPPTHQPIRLAITSPDSAVTSTTDATVTVKGTASGGNGTLVVTWSNARGGAGLAAGSADWRTPAISLIPGENAITVTVADSFGASASATVWIRYREATPPPPSPSIGPPTMQITSPAMTTLSASAASIAIRGLCSAGVVRVEWTSSSGEQGVAEGTAQWSIPSLPLLVGVNRVVVRARDAQGREAWRSLTVTRR